jgi:quercetin 2,3-dioxygenase
MFQMVQLWVNLPAKFKMSPPKYQGIKQDQMGRFEIENDGGVVEVIAGEYKGVKGAASTFTPINVYNMRLKKGAKVEVTLPAGYNTGALVADGKILVNEADHAVENDFVLFKNDGDTFTVQALEDSTVLVLNGEPILEPIVPYGPFLMNTKEEIMQAYRDVYSGAFGYLED